MACEHPVQKLTKYATDFVIAQKGVWSHENWEEFCTKAAKEGVELNDCNRKALGNLLEALRYFYELRPGLATAPVKKAGPCKKTASKAGSAK
jgi:hypothetical protein